MKIKEQLFCEQLTFEELRQKCKNHFLYMSYINLNNFKDPDSYWLNDELSNIVKSLPLGIFSSNDLINAFFSCIYEFEYKKIFLPGALIVSYSGDQTPQLGRLICFQKKYPLVTIRRYTQKGGLAKANSNLYLTNWNLVLKKDPAIKE